MDYYPRTPDMDCWVLRRVANNITYTRWVLRLLRFNGRGRGGFVRNPTTMPDFSFLFLQGTRLPITILKLRVKNFIGPFHIGQQQIEYGGYRVYAWLPCIMFHKMEVVKPHV